MERRYQVFISSTYEDLKEARHEVSQALLSANCFPAGMELFPAADDEQFNIIKSVIDQSDYYVVITAGRYGSIHPVTHKSYTEMEFEYADLKKKPIIALLHGSPQKLPQEDCELTDEGRRALEAFQHRLKSGRQVRTWTSPAELGHRTLEGLNWAKEHKPMPGWVRQTEIQDSKRRDAADKLHGSYTKEQVGEYLGHFFYAYRRAFGAPQNLDCTLFEFAWSEERSCVTFKETQTFPSPQGLEERTHKGEVFFNSAAPLVHLLTNDRAALRLLTLTRLRVDDATMSGILLSQYAGGLTYQPSTSPIFLQRQHRSTPREQLVKAIGLVRPQSAEYAHATRYLLDIERNLGIFALASRLAPSEDVASRAPAPPGSTTDANPDARPAVKH